MRKKILCGACVAMTLLLGMSGRATATTVYDTFAAWDGSTTIQPWGAPNTATYGQTFIAPLVDNSLDSFTFTIRAQFGTATDVFKAQVYAWSGSLLGGGGGGATGPALFSANMSQTFGNPGFTNVTVNTGGVTLTPGGQYVALFTVSDPADAAQSSGSTQWGLILSQHVAGGGGGGFAFYNNGNDFAALNTTPWDNPIDFGDLAWRAEFSPSAVPEPASLTLLGVGLAGVVRRLRRRNAA